MFPHTLNMKLDGFTNKLLGLRQCSAGDAQARKIGGTAPVIA